MEHPVDTDGGTMIQHGTLTADKDKPDAGVDDVESDLGTMVINEDEDDDDTMKRETRDLVFSFLRLTRLFCLQDMEPLPGSTGRSSWNTLTSKMLKRVPAVAKRRMINRS